MFPTSFVISDKIGKLITKSKSSSSVNILVSQSILALILLIGDVVFARYFDTNVFGTWKQLGLLIGLTIPLMMVGLPEAFKYFAAANSDKIYEHLKQILLLIIAVFLIVVVIFSMGAIYPLAGLLNNPSIINFRFMIPLLFIAMAINQVFRNLMINNRETQVLFQSSIVSLLVGFIFIALNLYVFQNYDHLVLWFTLPLMLIVLFSIPTVFYLIVKPKNVKSILKARWTKGITKYFKIGLPLYIATFIGVIGRNLDKALVSALSNVNQFAVYSVGAFEIPIFSMISASKSQAIFPDLVRLLKLNEKEKAKKLWLTSTYRISLITYPIILLLMIFAKPLIVLVFTEKYESAVAIFKIYLLIALWRNGYYGGLISAAGKTQYITLYSFLAVVSNIGFSYILYLYYGLYGVAYGALLSTSTIALLQLYHERLLTAWFKAIIASKILGSLVLLIFIFFFYESF